MIQDPYFSRDELVLFQFKIYLLVLLIFAAPRKCSEPKSEPKSKIRQVSLIDSPNSSKLGVRRLRSCVFIPEIGCFITNFTFLLSIGYESTSKTLFKKVLLQHGPDGANHRFCSRRQLLAILPPRTPSLQATRSPACSR
jgi:hypothetical protein